MKYFANVDLTTFWNDSNSMSEEFFSEPITDSLVFEVEKELGYALPKSYIELMKLHNGGCPVNTCYPMTEPTSWADDHIAITGIMGIGFDKDYSLCGEYGSKYMMEEWEYPEIGIIICLTPTSGHTFVMLDYSKCGSDGEPEVVFVDEERDYKTTVIAKNFETFIRGLVSNTYY